MANPDPRCLPLIEIELDQLPEDWFRTARLADSTRLVEILGGEQELPVVFAECRELIEAIVAEGA
jgi:hypothetical protein